MNGLTNMNEKVRETTTLRGICASIQKMAMPTFQNLTDILNVFGFNLIKKKQNSQ